MDPSQTNPGRLRTAMMLLGMMIVVTVWWIAHPVQRDGLKPLTVSLRIDLNTASSAELQLLPGIGPIIAAHIIDDRREFGPYVSLESFDRVPGIGPSTLARIEPFVTFSDAASHSR